MGQHGEHVHVGGIKLDIRQLKPSDMIGISLSPERQEQQKVRKLRHMGQAAWMQLVNLIDRQANSASIEEVSSLLQLEDRQEMEAYAARSNMTTIVQMLHDKTSRLMEMLLRALAAGKLCVVDVSQLRGQQSLILSSLILRKIFDHNQQEFTERESKTIPTIAVVEEAQSVLHENATGSEPYIAWVKEGRKYDLGAVLITQQPGSIPVEILSQGDNWFVFHLLSAADLVALQRANAHFSEDILSAVLNEPIAGQGVFWSSANQKPYPVAIRALSFELLYRARDLHGTMGAVRTYATELADDFARQAEELVAAAAGGSAVSVNGDGDAAPATNGSAAGIDVLEMQKHVAIQRLRQDTVIMGRLRTEKGQHWYGIGDFLKKQLPADMPDADRMAFSWVKDALDAVLGQEAWETHEVWNGQKDVKYARVKRDNGY